VPRHASGSEHRDGPAGPGGDADDDVAVAPLRRPRRLGEWPLGTVLLGVIAGLGVVANNHFRRGTVLIAGSVLLAAVLRAVLSERRAGLLVVRSRAVDVVTLGALGVGLTTLALVVPPPEESRPNGVGGDRPESAAEAGIASTAEDVLMTRDLHGSREA
jgi:hypothetical protein